MTEEKKPMKIEFAPGCFDNFEGTQEELDELMAKIQEMFDSGEAQIQAIPLEDVLDDMTDEELEQLAEQLGVDPDEYMIDEDDVEDIVPQPPTKRTLH